MTTTHAPRTHDNRPTPVDTPFGTSMRGRLRTRLAVPPWVLLVQVFIGLGWLRAAVEKVIDPDWWSGAVLGDFVTVQLDHALPWYRPFLETIVEPSLPLVALVVVVLQLAVAAALLSGRRLLTGLAVGTVLNLNFVAAGVVDPSIFYLLCQTALLLWLLHDRFGAAPGPLRLLAAASGALVLANLPFVTTLDPSGVIHDPAMVLATLGAVTTAASLSPVLDAALAGTDEAGPRGASQPAGRRDAGPP